MDTKNFNAFAHLASNKSTEDAANFASFAHLIPKSLVPESTLLDDVRNYGGAASSAFGQGIGGLEAGVGTFLQAPSANTLAGVLGARALADRGITNFINWVSPGSASLNEEAQEDARMASGFAAEAREENANSKYNIVAKAGKWAQDDGRDLIKRIQEDDQATNPELIRQQREVSNAEGFVGNLRALKDNPMAFTHTLVKSLPDMAIGLGAGRIAAGRVLATEATAAEMAVSRVAASGGDVVAQEAAAKIAMEAVRQRATHAASTAGMLSEGASSANSSRESSYNQVASMSFDQLAQSQRFNDLVSATGDKTKAREILANEVADQTPLLSGALTVGGTIATNKLFGGDATAKVLAGVDKASLKAVAKDAAQEGVEEVLQGVPQGFSDHTAMQIADPNKKFDLGGEIAQNLAAGVAMGGGGHGGGYAFQKAGELKSFVDAKQLTADNSISENSQSDIAPELRPKPTEAEAALMKPQNISSLDRVGEIDTELNAILLRSNAMTAENGYGPTFDGEREEFALQIAQLQDERNQITQSWPKAIHGAKASFSTEVGARLDSQYALMEVSDLQTSHDENLRANPVYPLELQPRERDRAASATQIQGIVAKFDPARLGLSADAATGAPIVGADGLVESGNARTITLKRIYQANAQKAQDYKAFLETNAGHFGLDPAQIASMDKPVLVRVRTTPVNRAEFARQANASTVARMSPVEQARSDAARMDVLDDLNPDDNGDFTASRDFIRRFMAKVPQTEIGELIDGDGKLSPAGYARMRNAVLAKAYGDSPVILRMTESLDDNLRNVSKALMQVAPQVAKVRSSIQEGHLHDVDITPDLLGAVEELSRIKDKGKTVKEYLSQSGMFGDKLTPEGAEMLQFLDENIRRPRQMAEFILRYTEALEAMGNPGQANIFDDNFKPTKSDLLTAARRDNDATPEPTPREGTSQESTIPAGQIDGERIDASGNEKGDQGNVEKAGRQAEQLSAPKVVDGWAQFGNESGTLGIPRSEMPQIKAEHRGAMVNFLKARDIASTQEDIKADTLKPTQAEYSIEKVDKAKSYEGGDRSILVSSDNHVLDGHHQWIAKKAQGEDVKVIRLDAPIKQLLETVRDFPSAETSQESTQIGGGNASTNDHVSIGKIAENLTGTRMIREESVPEILPALEKVFKEVVPDSGEDVATAIKKVKDKLKTDSKTKRITNLIKPETYEKAAKKAMETKADKLSDDVETVPTMKKTASKKLPAEKADSQKANTEDAGEELAYNKRNRVKTGIKWEDIENKDVALRVKETTKQNVYPRPDYEYLIAGGMQPIVAHIVKQAYDSIAAVPASSSSALTDDQLKSYISAVHHLMDSVMSWAKDDANTAKWVARLASRAGKSISASNGARMSMMELVDTPEKSLLDTVYPNGWRENRDQLRILGGNKIISALQPSVVEAIKAMKEIDKGWPSKQEAWQKQGYKTLAGSDLHATYYESKATAHHEAYVSVSISSKLAKHGSTLLHETFDGIDSKEEPRVKEWVEQSLAKLSDKVLLLDKLNRIKAITNSQQDAEEKARELTKRTKNTDEVNEKGISVEMAVRMGAAYRMPGEDVSSGKLMDTFGFRGINFGNWMKGDSNTSERQLHLNHIYDAFMDLAGVLDVQPKAMSLNGMLGVAVGAQGNGKNAAHFVPGLNEINLTRTAGAGALAHEWGHALDHYFARQADLVREADSFLTEHAEMSTSRNRMIFENGRYIKKTVQTFGENIRPEIIDAFGRIVKAMKKRPITVGEQKLRNQQSIDRARKHTEGWVKAIRRDFVSAKANDENIAAYDSLAEKVMSLDLGDGKIAISSATSLSQPVFEMRELYKKLTGKNYSLEQIKGLQSNVDHYDYVMKTKDDIDTHLAQDVATTYATNATVLDGDKGGKPYWSTNVEMFARAFDAFVGDKLAETAAKNTYLHGLNNDVKTTPMGEERIKINTEFQKLVDTIEQTPTDDGVALFSRNREEDLHLKMPIDDGFYVLGIPTDILREKVESITKNWANAPKVNYVDVTSELPFAAPRNVRGAYYRGQVYLVGANIKSESEAQIVLFHEALGHAGLRGLFGNQINSALHDVAARNQALAKAAKLWRQQNNDIRGKRSDSEWFAASVEEALAQMSESGKKIKGIQRFLAKLQELLRGMGLHAVANWMENASNAEVMSLLSNARSYIADGAEVHAFGHAEAQAYSMSENNGDEKKTPTLEELLATAEDEITIEAPAPLSVSGEEIERAASIFLSTFPEGTTRHLPNSATVRKAKHYSEAATADLGGAGSGSPEVQRGTTQALGSFTGYDTKGRITQNFYGGEQLTIELWGREQIQAGLDDIPALTIEVQPDGDFSIYALPSSSDTYKEFVARGWAEPATGKNKEIQYFSGNDGEFWTRLTNTKRADLLPLLGDIHARALAWTGKPYIGLSWQRTTGASGGMDGHRAAVLFRRDNQNKSAAERADEIINTSASTPAPVDKIIKSATQLLQIDKATRAIYDGAAFILNRYTPESLKAGFVSDYGVPEAVIDRRAGLSGHMNVQTRKAGKLIDKLSTLTREESRVAYEWMNNSSPDALKYFENQLPEESVKVLAEVKDMIDALSKEAVALGQLSHEAYEQNKMEYLRRSYAKHTLGLDEKEKKRRARAISVLGDQYKGRGLTESAPMKKMQNVAPEWWGRKLKEGKADKQLKGEQFIRLERHAHSGEGTMPMESIGDRSRGRLQEVVYYPVGERLPSKYAEWDHAGTFEVWDTKGENLILWRDFTKAERENMGEIDEARFAIAKTLYGMIHDVEVGRYMEWLGKKYALTHATQVPGNLVEAKEMGLGTMHTVYKKGDWVRIPETKVSGTDAYKYGKLAGKYLPGPIWNDIRQINSGSFKPLGDVYASILKAWKMSKTALSPAVHMNNVMANFVMADWHDVSAGHIAKALRILMAASDRDGTGLIGTAQNIASRAGIADRDAAKEIVARYQDSGGNIGTWASAELQTEQIQPLLDALEAEASKNAASVAAQVGVMNALQMALNGRFADAGAAAVGSKTGKAVVSEGKNLIDLYQSEDEVFRLAAWLKAKEDGETDMQAGHKSRRSFLDYNINAPWMAGLRATALPFAAFSYRAIPMMAETVVKRPWKIMKLAMLGGMLNTLGYMLSGGNEDDERRYLPEEKAGRVWGMVPKLIRMPWNDEHAQPVFLDVRRFIPVGDVFDLDQQHSAVPLPPAVMPGGPIALVGEIVLNKSMFTGKAITEETDTGSEKVGKTIGYLYKSMMPNLPILPGTHAWDSVAKANSGGTDAFGRELSTGQAALNSIGIKVGSYGMDMLRLNAAKKLQSEMMEIDHNVAKLKREYARKGMTYEDFVEKAKAQQDKKAKLAQEFRAK